MVQHQMYKGRKKESTSGLLRVNCYGFGGQQGLVLCGDMIRVAAEHVYL